MVWESLITAIQEKLIGIKTLFKLILILKQLLDDRNR